MASSNELINKRNKYYTLKDNVNSVLRSITTTYNDLVAADHMSEAFTIDGDSADGAEIVEVKNNIGTIKDRLEKQVLPDIISKIDSLSREIENALNREDEERQREEEREIERQRALYGEL